MYKLLYIFLLITIASYGQEWNTSFEVAQKEASTKNQPIMIEV